MTDIVHTRDDHARLLKSGTPATDRPRGRREDARLSAPPRTDVGTFLLHWVTAITFLVSLFTGLRFAADNPDAVVSNWLTPILPQGELWTWHFVAGFGLLFCGTAYLFYMRRSGLARRAAPKKLRVFLLPVVSRLRWGAVNVALHWLLYGLVLTLAGTGIVLYLGHGGWWVYVHSTAAFISIGYIFAHIVSHYAYGGWQQLLRVLRPAALVVTRAVRPRPLLVGVAIGISVAASLAAVDWGTRDTVVVARVQDAPRLDGVLDDAVWQRTAPVSIHTQQGVNLGGTGESVVEVRAVHDGTNVYFAFRWEDPTRSLRRVPMIKRTDGWHILEPRADIAEVNTFYEDKFAIGFALSPSYGSGNSTHLGSKPIGDKPAPLHRRGYHYTPDGALIDVWQWKASRGGELGYVDDQYFAEPREPTSAEAAGQARYQAGYWNDPGRAFYSYNYKSEPPGGYRGPVTVQRLPRDWKATVKALGRFDFDPDSNDQEGARWWMTEAESVPYSAELDASIPTGTAIPGVLIMGNYEGDRADLRGASRWSGGHWHLEVVRKLRTGSKFDHDFVPGRDLYMWVNVFDHTQTRHTRHARPVRVVVEE